MVERTIITDTMRIMLKKLHPRTWELVTSVKGKM